MQKIYRKIPFFLLSLFLCCLFLNGCGKEKEEEGSKAFQSFLDESFKTLTSHDGLTLHRTLLHPEDYDIDKSACTNLPDLSEKGMAEELKELKTMDRKLDEFQNKSLSKKQKVLSVLLKNDLSLSIESKEKYPYYRSLLGGNGSFCTLSLAFSEYDLRDAKDIQIYQKLLTQIPTYIDQMVSYETHRMEQGLLPSKNLLSETLDSYNNFAKMDLKDNPYITSFEKKISEADFLGKEEKTSFLEKNTNLVKNTVIPSYKKAAKALKANLTTKKHMDNLSQYPQGDAYFSHLLKYNIGTDRSPEEWIRILTGELKTISSEMETILKENPDVETDYVLALPKETSADSVLQELKNDTLIEFPAIKDVPCTTEDILQAPSSSNTMASYIVPPIDATGENHIYLNGTSTIDSSLFHTLAHEGYPGHLYQTNYFYENMYHPIQYFLKVKGYDEGWGKYAEYYSYDFTPYSNIEEDDIPALQRYSLAHDTYYLYLSCLCDLNVNYKGYDKKQLRTYLADYNIAQENSDAMYAYVCEKPLEYLNYGLGYYEFKDLLKKAQEKEDFSMASFHESILSYGSCPFYLLSSFVNEK